MHRSDLSCSAANDVSLLTACKRPATNVAATEVRKVRSSAPVVWPYLSPSALAQTQTSSVCPTGWMRLIRSVGRCRPGSTTSAFPALRLANTIVLLLANVATDCHLSSRSVWGSGSPAAVRSATLSFDSSWSLSRHAWFPDVCERCHK
jgi:hypothetical protein